MFWLELAQEVIKSAAAPIVAVAAIFALWTWRRELRGRAEQQAARRILIASKKIAEGIGDARDAFTSAAELAARKSLPGEPFEEHLILDEEYARRMRRKQLRDDYYSLWEGGIEAEVFWGRHARENVEALQRCAMDLSASHNRYFGGKMAYLRDHKGLENFTSTEIYREHHDIVYSLEGDEAFGDRVDDALEAIERYFRRYLR